MAHGGAERLHQVELHGAPRSRATSPGGASWRAEEPSDFTGGAEEHRSFRLRASECLLYGSASAGRGLDELRDTKGFSD